MHLQSKLYSARLSWALVLTWVSPIVQDKNKRWGLGWEESRLSHNDIRAEGALPPSITVIARNVMKLLITKLRAFCPVTKFIYYVFNQV